MSGTSIRTQVDLNHTNLGAAEPEVDGSGENGDDGGGTLRRGAGELLADRRLRRGNGGLGRREP